MVESYLLFLRVGAGAGAGENKYPDPEPAKNGPAQQHCLCKTLVFVNGSNSTLFISLRVRADSCLGR